MVRETRHLWIGNLPNDINSGGVLEHFTRYGRIQAIKLFQRKEAQDDDTGTNLCATVAFMDIVSASKAHKGSNIIGGRRLITMYYEQRRAASDEEERNQSGEDTNSLFTRRSNHIDDFDESQWNDVTSSRNDGADKLSDFDDHPVVPSAAAAECLVNSRSMCIKNFIIELQDSDLKEALIKEYEQIGDLSSVRLYDQGPERFAIVTFTNDEDCTKAIESSEDKEILECKVDISSVQAVDAGGNAWPVDDELSVTHCNASRMLVLCCLEPTVTAADIQERLDLDEILEIDVMFDSTPVLAYVEFCDIESVVKVIRQLDGELFGSTRVRAGFGKTKPTNCLWMSGITETVDQTALTELCERYGTVKYTALDSAAGLALVMYDQLDCAAQAFREFKLERIRDSVLQIDYASEVCQDMFLERAAKEGRSLQISGSRKRIQTPPPPYIHSHPKYERAGYHHKDHTIRSRSRDRSSERYNHARKSYSPGNNYSHRSPPRNSYVKSHKRERSHNSENNSLCGKAPRAIAVRNLSSRSTDSSLKDGLFHEFKKVGKVTSVKVVGHGTNRYAVVSFKKPEDVSKALETCKGKVFFGNAIEVSPTDEVDVEDNTFPLELNEFHPKATRTLFIGDLDKNTTSSDISKHFGQFGNILDIDIKAKSSPVYAFVQFTDIKSVVKAIRHLDGEYLGSTRVRLGFARSAKENCIWIDGIAEAITSDSLARQFESFGPVIFTAIDRLNGQALVMFDKWEFATDAMNSMKGRILNQRRLQVDYASTDCQNVFVEKLERRGHSYEINRAVDKGGRGPLHSNSRGAFNNGGRRGRMSPDRKHNHVRVMSFPSEPRSMGYRGHSPSFRYQQSDPARSSRGARHNRREDSPERDFYKKRKAHDTDSDSNSREAWDDQYKTNFKKRRDSSTDS